MTMEEQRLSELLKRSVPEPPFELSADRVTVPHIDRSRRSWLLPALAAAAVVLVAAAGVGLNATRHPSPASSAQQKGQVTLTPTAASTTAGPAEAPTRFNPLVLPVNFGWLPAEFSENEPETGEFSNAGGQIGVTTTQASFGASAADGRGFTVTVAARGAKATPWITSAATETLGNTGASKVTGTAPDINGRPAKWLADGLEWEYANGGWATLLAGGKTKAQAQQGWGRYCTGDIPDLPKGTKSPAANPKVSCAPYTPSAQFRALLAKVASNLTWTPQSFTFPYRFIHALPTGWTVSEVTGEFVNGRLTSVQTNLAPKDALNTKDPLNIQAFSSGNTADCAGFAFSGTTFATYNGVTWAIQADHSAATACAGARMSKKSTGSVGMGFAQDTVAYLPTPLGPSGVKVMLPLFKFLGTNPANWTTNPFAN
jgi:hypothetical protein